MKRSIVCILGSLTLVLPLLACTGGMLTASQAPRWACPSPEPLPYGPSGPVKAYTECNCYSNPTTGGRVCDRCPIYYAEWEQEYGDLGGPPFPSPTPYSMTGTSYAFGQRVEVWPFHVLVTVEHGAPLQSPAAQPDSQLYRISIAWINHTAAAVPMDYTIRVRLRSVTNGSGRILSSDSWGVTAQSLQAAGSDALPSTIPPGQSTVVVPIIGPAGSAKTVDVQFLADPNAQPPRASPPRGIGTPTAPPPPPVASDSPTPNAALADPAAQYLTVQWNAVTLRNGAPCDSPGALTAWGDVGVAGVLVNPAPPGEARVLQIARNQVGKPYVWGAKGPETFDCSGLTEWSYGQIGIRIPRGTAGQWPQMRPVEREALQPGDLIFFAIAGGRVDHVGLVGDFNGDGQWDLLHAASPALGVRIDYSVFASRYYTARITGFRTAR